MSLNFPFAAKKKLKKTRVNKRHCGEIASLSREHEARFPPSRSLGAGAVGPDRRAAGGGLQEEEPHRSAGPPDPHAQRKHQHSD